MLPHLLLRTRHRAEALAQIAPDRRRARLDAPAHSRGKARHAALDQGEHAVGLRLFRCPVSLAPVLRVGRGGPARQRRPDEEKGRKPGRGERGILQRRQVERDIPLVQRFLVVDEHLHGRGVPRQGGALHGAVDDEARHRHLHAQDAPLPSPGDEPVRIERLGEGPERSRVEHAVRAELLPARGRGDRDALGRAA